MCGICGSYGLNTDRAGLEAATDRMFHRGPDEAGYFCDGPVALGMRRLRIIDLAGGSQPMTDERNQIHVIYNGEIYNFLDLREQLIAAGHTFATHCDTEVLVHGYEEWNVGVFARLNGIFAVAIWDACEERMVLARDHLGVKPLYFRHSPGTLAFGSELKPVLAMTSIPALDPTSATLYLRYQYIPSPRSIYAGIRKLPPAHYLVFRPGRSDVEICRYWSALSRTGRHTAYAVDEAREKLDATLRAAVRRQMMSDVPLGAFLSGGVDSSIVVAMMQSQSDRPVKTFSIGFEHDRVDESAHARRVADHLGTDHFGWTITEREALDVVPRLPYFFDEPFADASAIPTFLVSQLARRHVTVSLSGDGGDELFGGYEIYGRLRQAKAWWRMPRSMRRMLLPALARLPGPPGNAVRRADDILARPTLSEAFRDMMSVTRTDPLARLATARGVDLPNPEWPAHLFQQYGLDEAMMLTDLHTYLPDDILTKVDRASMANSLEARVPILDLQMVEYASGLPPELRLHAGPKSLLKDVLARYVPRELFDRPKQGFAVPMREWLRGALRPIVEDALQPQSLASHGLLEPREVQTLWQQHLNGTHDWSQSLWAIVMLQLWSSQVAARV